MKICIFVDLLVLFLSPEKVVKVTKTLHIDGLDVREHGDITLSCTVNTLTKAPIWLHNGKELKYGARVSALAKGHTHTLTILNVQIKDEGSYTVAFGDVLSETQVTVKGKLLFCFIYYMI